jgi:hypothetical protein
LADWSAAERGGLGILCQELLEPYPDIQGQGDDCS